jgi:hypothetical protein
VWDHAPAARGPVGMPKEILEKMTGYGPDVAKNQSEARKIMEDLGVRAPGEACRRCAAEQHDELAPFQLTKLHPLPLAGRQA